MELKGELSDGWQAGGNDAAGYARIRQLPAEAAATSSLQWSKVFLNTSTKLARFSIMSHNDAASSALGKRARDSADDVEGNGVAPDVPDMPAGDLDDSSDEEIGPMPVAEEADGAVENGKGRKKRKRAGKC